MTINAPSSDQLNRIAAKFGLELTDQELVAITNLAAGVKTSYDRLDELTETRLPVRYPRTLGRPPKAEENPYNAWAWISDIEGASTGPLKGVRVGIKDNICVAGQPMRNGSRILEGFIPDIDATVVTRVLDAGGTIAGKTVCEDLCFSGSSHTSQPAPVRNPYDPTRATGGSSSGSAAAIAVGDVSMCLGGDQGGSIRTPASWSGVVGLKPTHGLVPYTGAFPIEPTMDHLGPMGRSVEDVARLLTVIAGPDGHDPRQAGAEMQDYMAALNEPLAGLRVGIVQEGFGRPDSFDASDLVVKNALRELASAGAVVEEISIPWHLDGYHVSAPIIMEGSSEFMLKANAMGYGWQGYYATSLSNAWAQGWRSRPGDIPDIAKFVLLFSEYMHDSYHGRFYAKAQNLRRELRSAYDRALTKFDVLAMPTTPFPATPLPAQECGFEKRVAAGLDMEGNTAPFDVSGHPALSIPCGMNDGLPIGLMFIANRFDERSALRAAMNFERLSDWKKM